MTPWFAFDLDDSVGEFNESAYRAFNAHRGTSYAVSEAQDYHLLDRFGYTVPEFWNLLYELRVCADMEPTPGVVEAMQTLRRKGGRIHIITARKQLPNHFDVTQEWLERHNVPCDALTICHRQHHQKGHFLCSSTVALVEDSAEQLRSAPHVPYRVLVERPWNRNERELGWLYTKPEGLVQVIERMALHVG